MKYYNSHINEFTRFIFLKQLICFAFITVMVASSCKKSDSTTITSIDDYSGTYSGTITQTNFLPASSGNSFSKTIVVTKSNDRYMLLGINYFDSDKVCSKIDDQRVNGGGNLISTEAKVVGTKLSYKEDIKIYLNYSLNIHYVREGTLDKIQ